LSSAVVTLFDGHTVDLADYDIKGLVSLQFDEETRFAEAIKMAAPFSQERAELTRRGYALIHAMLAHRCERNQQPFGLGDKSFGPSVAVAVVKQMLKHRRKLSFFEAGFGTGAVLDAVARVPEVEVCGCDVDLSNVGKRGGDYKLFEGSAYDVLKTFADNVVDVFFWSEVVEHVPVDEIEGYLRLIYSKLSQGAYLVTIMPNWHMRPMDITQLMFPRGTEAKGFHLKEYTLREYSRLLFRNGFTSLTSPFFFVPGLRRAVLGFGWMARVWHGVKQRCEPVLGMIPFPVRPYFVKFFGFDTMIARK